MLVLETARHKARKRHVCDSCRGAIEPGATYVRQRNVYEGEARTYKAHADCWAASEIVGTSSDWHGDVYPNICDFEPEDRIAVAKEDAALAARLWPGIAPCRTEA